jgi:hypothetical protein
VVYVALVPERTPVPEPPPTDQPPPDTADDDGEVVYARSPELV